MFQVHTLPDVIETPNGLSLVWNTPGARFTLTLGTDGISGVVTSPGSGLPPIGWILPAAVEAA